MTKSLTLSLLVFSGLFAIPDNAHAEELCAETFPVGSGYGRINANSPHSYYKGEYLWERNGRLKHRGMSLARVFTYNPSGRVCECVDKTGLRFNRDPKGICRALPQNRKELANYNWQELPDQLVDAYKKAGR